MKCIPLKILQFFFFRIFLLFCIYLHFTMTCLLSRLLEVCGLKNVESVERNSIYCCYYCPDEMRNVKKFFSHCFLLSDDNGFKSNSHWMLYIDAFDCVKYLPQTVKRPTDPGIQYWVQKLPPGDCSSFWLPPTTWSLFNITQVKWLECLSGPFLGNKWFSLRLNRRATGSFSHQELSWRSSRHPRPRLEAGRKAAPHCWSCEGKGRKRTETPSTNPVHHTAESSRLVTDDAGCGDSAFSSKACQLNP